MKGFDPASTAKDLEDVFRPYGDIESIKLVPNSTFACAFVCFKTPDQAQKAKSELPQQFPGIFINHYELKEIRDMQMEETKDRRDFQHFKSVNNLTHSAWNEIQTKDEFYYKLMQVF